MGAKTFQQLSPRQRTRKQLGFCIQCGEPAVTKAWCQTHRDRYAQKAHHRRAKLKARGRCIECRAPRGIDGTTARCRPCADRMNSYSRALIARRLAIGVCPKHSTPVGRFHYCRICRANGSGYRRSDRTEAIAA